MSPRTGSRSLEKPCHVGTTPARPRPTIRRPWHGMFQYCRPLHHNPAAIRCSGAEWSVRKEAAELVADGIAAAADN